MSPLEEVDVQINLSDESGDFGAVVYFSGRWVPEPRYFDEQQEYSVELEETVVLEIYWRTTLLNRSSRVIKGELNEYLKEYFANETREKLEVI